MKRKTSEIKIDPDAQALGLAIMVKIQQYTGPCRCGGGFGLVCYFHAVNGPMLAADLALDITNGMKPERNPDGPEII